MKYKFSFGEVDSAEFLNSRETIISDHSAIIKTLTALMGLDLIKIFSIIENVKNKNDVEIVSELGYTVKLFNIPNSDDIEIHVQYCIPYSLKIIGRITPHDFTIITKIVLNSIYGKRG